MFQNDTHVNTKDCILTHFLRLLIKSITYCALREEVNSQIEQQKALERPKLKPPTIRDAVQAEAEKAYPDPVRARDLKETLEEQRGEEMHDKTIGMTLYRLSKDGIMRREGWDWYFVPPDKQEDNDEEQEAELFDTG